MAMDLCSLPQAVSPFTLTSFGLLLDFAGFVIVAFSVRWKESIDDKADKKLQAANTYKEVRERYERNAAEEARILEGQGVRQADLNAAKKRDKAQLKFFDDRTVERQNEAADYRYLGIRIEKFWAKVAMSFVIAGTLIQFIDSVRLCPAV